MNFDSFSLSINTDQPKAVQAINNPNVTLVLTIIGTKEDLHILISYPLHSYENLINLT